MKNQQGAYHWENIDHDGSLVNFAERNCLKVEHFDYEKEVIILPRNTYLPDLPQDRNLFPGGTKELKQTFNEAGLKAAIYSDEREKRELLLNTADIVLPVFLFIGTSAVSVGLSILSNWIYDRFVRGKNVPEPQIKVEYAELDMKRNVVQWRRIEAPASHLHAVLSDEAGVTPDNDHKPLPGSDKCEVPSDDWNIYCEKEAESARAVAKTLIEESRELIEEGNVEVAENLARRALQRLREACLWQPHIAEHKRYLHKVGKFVHDQFTCMLEYKDDLYWVTCPVLLSHSKGGFSIAGSGRTICSICGKELIDCPHLGGRSYDNVAASRRHGMCNICGERECGHIEGAIYDGVRGFGVVVEISLDHVSLVENPANPLCVLQKCSLPRDKILRSLRGEEGSETVQGESTIYCHHCLCCDGSSMDD